MSFPGRLDWWRAPLCGFLLALSDILNELFQRENRVLHYWTMRKRRLDQCQQYVVFERSAKQVSQPTAPGPTPRAQGAIVRGVAADPAADGWSHPHDQTPPCLLLKFVARKRHGLMHVSHSLILASTSVPFSSAQQSPSWWFQSLEK